MTRPLIVAGLGAVLIGTALVAVGQIPAMTDADGIVLRHTDSETLAMGAEVYRTTCAACHGADLEGQPDWRAPGPGGRLPAPPHDATGHTWHHDSETLFRLTKYGLAALIGDPDHVSDMPAYAGRLTDEEIVAVLSYIKSTWPPEIRDRHSEMDNTP